MAKVQLLERSVAERIAAGEVVERPASVVKELVENSLDAGADHITVELQAGGTTLLRVIDNGCGMSPEDARLALERFATSKIHLWEDLDRLETMGFRGEALPSIAAVSRVEILTCEAGSPSGTEIAVEGGQMLRCQAAAAVPGTRITVSDLFFNTPARRKFLKTPAAETSQVIDLLTRLALIRPDVSFQVRSNGREALLVTRQMTVAQRLSVLWKVPTEALVPFSGEVMGVKAEGLVALPQYARPTRSQQLFSINRRLIRSASLSQAILEGFNPLLPRGKYPVALVNLTLDPALVDVNVHPTKAEVRFAEAKSPFRVIYRSIAAALEQTGADTVQDSHWELVGPPEPETEPVKPPTESEPPADNKGESWPPPARPQPQLAAEPRSGYDWRPRPAPAHVPRPSTAATLEMFRPLELPETPARVRVLAQLYRTFIVAEVDDEMWIVDQHTAHERIWYERLARLSPLDGATQGLLIPEVLEFTPTVAAFVEGYLEPLQELGFEVEPFGGEAFQLRALPLGLKPGRGASVLRSVVEQAAAEQISVKGDAREHLREKLRAMASCKAAVKAGEALSQGEMTTLIQEMLEVEHSLYCPHGRPTRVKLDSRALERLFHR